MGLTVLLVLSVPSVTRRIFPFDECSQGILEVLFDKANTGLSSS